MEINILYEDTDILVCEKPAKIASQGTRSLQIDLCDLLKNHITKQSGTKNPYLGVVHRLDQPVGGVMVYAKTPLAAKDLSRQIKEQGMKKKYYAILTESPNAEEGYLYNYLYKDGKTNTSIIVEEKDKNKKDVKKAELYYKVLKSIRRENTELYLVEVDLKTGRHHQIRVQFAHLGCPLWGDIKYNPKAEKNIQRDLGLFSYQLKFQHPKTKKNGCYQVSPKNGIFSYFFG